MMRRRLVITAAVTVALALLPVTALFYIVLSRVLEADARTLLSARAAAASAAMSVEVGSSRLVPVESSSEVALDASTWVFDRTGSAVEKPLLGVVPDTVASSLAGVARARFRVIGDVLLLAVPIRGGAGGTVVASLSRLPYEHAERTALLSALVLDAVVLLAVAAVTWRTVTAALAPVARMTVDAAEWGAHDVQRRFALGPARDELTGLASTLDGLLERLSVSLTHERRLTAEIAHELRTPVARIRAEAEVALRGRRTTAELREVLRAVTGDAEQLTQTIHVLLHSAAAHSTVPDQQSDPTEVLREVLAAARLLDPDTTVTGEAGAGLPPLALSTGQVLQVLSPLLDNAVRYGHGAVQVRVRHAGTRVMFEIRDNGPGFGPDESDAVFGPGTRGRAAAGPGVGLGLALARRLARAAGGDVTAHPATGTGVIKVSFPHR